MKIGVDIGGHTITAALIAEPKPNAPGSVPVIERSINKYTPKGRSVSYVVGTILETVSDLARDCEIERLGISIPGMLDAGRKKICAMANFPSEWTGLDIADAVSGALASHDLRFPVRIENDANCYALGEGYAGEAVGVDDFLVLTLGTGIGCGIVAGGRLLTGAHGMAGEAGHIVVMGDALCACGGKGHPETFATADGVASMARAARLPEDFRILWPMRGEKKADEVLETALDAMARTIASVALLLDPGVVIIGGGMSKASGLLEALHERALPYIATPYRKFLNLKLSKLGEVAPLFGAAAI